MPENNSSAVGVCVNGGLELDLWGTAGGEQLVGGIDEAGRGPLAGPVVAAVVILAPGQTIPGVRDSKQLRPEQREELAIRIRAVCVEWYVAEATPNEIDEINILQATMLAMSRAFAGLKQTPGRIQVDGNRLPRLNGYSGALEAVIGGDRTCHAISAASILAKVHRDEAMRRYDAEFPGYGFAGHKGYGTQAHLEALFRQGPSAIHRHSFAPVRAALRGVFQPVPGEA